MPGGAAASRDGFGDVAQGGVVPARQDDTSAAPEMTGVTGEPSAVATGPVAGGRPTLPFTLGLSGLVPFWALAIAKATGWPHAIPPGEIAGMLATYGATILSFLGGIRWGVAVAAPNQPRVATDYVFGVTPQLFAWGALVLPDPWRFVVLAVGVLPSARSTATSWREAWRRTGSAACG